MRLDIMAARHIISSIPRVLLVAALLVGSRAMIATSAAQPVSARAAVSIDYAAPQGTLLRTERYNNFTSMDKWAAQRPADAAFYNEQGLHGKIYRVWINDKGFDPKTGLANWSEVVSYLRDASTISDSILANVSLSETIKSGKSPDEIRPIVKAIVKQLKAGFPKVAYIEAFNEPDWGFAKLLKPTDLYAYYKAFYQAVNEVNGELRPAVPLKVGGPAFMAFDVPWMKAFLDGYKADPSPTKRLDFISYHAYGEFDDLSNMAGSFMFKTDPSRLATIRGRLDAELESRGLDTAIPSFITETGLYPGPSFDDPKDPHGDALRQAAGMASYSYWFMSSPKVVPFNWVLRHQTEERKDQLVTRAGDGNPIPTRTFTPYGNMMLMLSKMKATRIAASTDGLKDGKGVYVLAAKDKSGISMLVWNYQGKGTGSFDAAIDLSHLPKTFGGKPARERVFVIDQTTSDYFADPARANLQMVSERLLTPGSTYRKTISLDANALQLILLEKPTAK